MNFEVTVDEANLIVTALAELPFKASAALIQKLQQQGKAQLEQVQQPQQTSDDRASLIAKANNAYHSVSSGSEAVPR